MVRWQRGKCSVFLWLDLSISVSFCLWTVTFPSVSQIFFSSLVRWDRMTRVGWNWIFPFSTWMSRVVRVRYFFSCRSVRLWNPGRSGCGYVGSLWTLSQWFSFSPSAKFSFIVDWELVKVSEVELITQGQGLWCMSTLDALTLAVVCNEPMVIHRLQFKQGTDSHDS